MGRESERVRERERERERGRERARGKFFTEKKHAYNTLTFWRRVRVEYSGKMFYMSQVQIFNSTLVLTRP